MTAPYYEDDAVTILHGDCRGLLPSLPAADAIVTDPTWPNARVPLFGCDDPEGMFRDMFAALPALPARLAVQLGCDSDPRFLGVVPSELPFFRVAWLELVRIGYRGRLGHTGDVGYLFGEPPPATPGRHIIPGRITDPDPNGKQADHPCPRKIGHVMWLVNRWTDPGDLVCDPFAGSGTTGVACRDLGRRCVLIEVEERFCEEAAKRCSQQAFAL
jgi:site-specific DNA-methyltransferase (adenine-specific)